MSTVHYVRTYFTRHLLNPSLQILLCLEFFAFEFGFEIAEQKGITWNDIMVVARLMSMTGQAIFNNFFSFGGVMRCGIVAFSRCQNGLSASLNLRCVVGVGFGKLVTASYLIEEVAVVELSSRREQIRADDAADVPKHNEYRFPVGYDTHHSCWHFVSRSA
jgi:hypothetical protein